MSTRHCVNCQQPVERNPDNLRKWVHVISGSKKCSRSGDRDAFGLTTVATPTPVVIPADVTMVTVGDYPVWYREHVFFDRGEDPDTDYWTSAKQGMPSKTSTELVNDAELRGVEVYALARREKLS